MGPPGPIVLESDEKSSEKMGGEGEQQLKAHPIESKVRWWPPDGTIQELTAMAFEDFSGAT